MNVHLLAVLSLFDFGSSVLPAPSNAEYAFTQITAPFAGTDQTLAFGINDLGWIVGAYHDAGGDHAYLLRHGQFTPIEVPFPGASDTIAFGINLQGQIVGIYNTSDGSLHGFLLSRGEFTTIDAPSPGETFARGINLQGDIVGWYRDGAGTHGFLWTRGVFTSIDVPFAGAHDTMAAGINSLGRIVGSYTGDDGHIHGFILHRGHFAPLDEPGATETLPYGINAVDQIVGSNFIFEHGRFEPLSGTPANPAPNILAQMAINDFGLVLVIAQTAAGETAFLATPIRKHF